MKIRVTAVPEHGKANNALLALLSETLSLAEQNIRLIKGVSSANKVVDIQGLDENELMQRLKFPRR